MLGGIVVFQGGVAILLLGLDADPAMWFGHSRKSVSATGYGVVGAPHGCVLPIGRGRTRTRYDWVLLLHQKRV